MQVANAAGATPSGIAGTAGHSVTIGNAINTESH
jgi:hypothetical protein